MIDQLPAPPATKEELISLLRHASQLEHALCAQYLYAAFTLRSAGETGVGSFRAALYEQWNQQMTRIAIQEMYHLLLASNLLTCLGATPWLSRPPFPQRGSTYSGIDLPLKLAPFSYQTISLFLCWEKPFTEEPDLWWDAVCKACSDKPAARVAAASPSYTTIGELYAIIEAGFHEHPEWVDAGSATRQVTNDLIAFKPCVAPITRSSHAEGYVREIVREGEGLRAWKAKSHFAYFHQMLAQLKALGETGAGFSGASPSVENPIFDPKHVAPGRSLIDDPAAASSGVLLNTMYLAMMKMLHRLFVPNGESDAERRSLAKAALAIMPLGIKPLATRLTRTPAGDAHPGFTAGPSFELPARFDVSGAHKEEVFPDLQRELRDVARQCRILGMGEVRGSLGAVDDLATIAARLETLLPLLEPQRAAAP